MKRALTAVAVASLYVILAAGCTVAVRERDPAKPYHYDERYDYTDLKVMSTRMASSLLSNPPLSRRDDKPIIVTYPIDNRTSQHIDTANLMDSIRTAVHEGGKARFAAKEARRHIEEELGYQASGRVSPEDRVKVGKQLGARYILAGRLTSIEKEQPKQVRAKKKELVYYKRTMELTSMETGLYEWTDEQAIVREISKPFFGW